MTAPQSGWYPNPDGSGDLRFWDGTSWTQDRRPAPGQESVQFPPQDMSPPEAAGHETVQFPPEPPAAEVAPGNDTTLFPPAAASDEPADADAGTHETIQFPPAPPEPEHAGTDTIQFPPDPTPADAPRRPVGAGHPARPGRPRVHSG